MEQYRRASSLLAAASARRQSHLWHQQQAGALAPDDWIPVAALSIATFNAKASTLADVAAALVLTRLLGDHVDPSGVMLPDPTDRLMIAFATILDQNDDPDNGIDGAASVVRIGTAEPLAAGQQTQREAYQGAGVERWTRGVSGGACSVCQDLAGPTLPMDIDMWVHPGCVGPETLLTGPAVKKAYCRAYQGDAFVIETAGGRNLTITPNHPVLTPHGWVAAADLDKGAHLICSRGPHFTGGRYENNVPSRAQELWRSHAVIFGRREVPFSAEDFHGDGVADGQVDVVDAAGALRRRLDALSSKQAGQLCFEHGLMAALRFDGRSSLLPFTDRRLATGCGSISSRSYGLAFSERGVAVMHESGFLPSPYVYAAAGQAMAYHAAYHAESIRDRQLRFSRFVGGDDFSVRRGYQATSDHAQAVQFAQKDAATNPDGSRDLIDALAGDIELDRITQKRRISFSGHVYNLETSEGWYGADGIVVHNCDCSQDPV